jgi:uncharacterized membrane protein YbhN (UPF0104 family)
MGEWTRREFGKRLVRLLGWAIALAGFAFLASALSRLDLSLLAATLAPAAWYTTLLAAAAYALLLPLLSRAWLEVAADRAARPWSMALQIYGPSVIAKYLPGSVFHYASRQLRGGKHGLSQKRMAFSSMMEAILHVVCASLVAGFLMLPAFMIALPIVIAACVLILLRFKRGMLRAAAWQLLFFLGFAAILIVLARLLPGLAEAKLAVAMFLFAWIAGFLVPVAPGGIGIREAALLALAGPLASPEALAMFAILTRLVTILGDCLFGLAANCIALGEASDAHRRRSAHGEHGHGRS